MYLQPYGWTEELPPDHDEMDPVWAAAKAATDLLYGRNYRQGPTYTTIYPASGLGLDYMYVGADVPFSIATEMRSSNGNGPADPVLPGSQEVWEGIKAAGLYVLNNYEPPGRGERSRCVLCAASLRSLTARCAQAATATRRNSPTPRSCCEGSTTRMVRVADMSG